MAKVTVNFEFDSYEEYSEFMAGKFSQVSQEAKAEVKEAKAEVKEAKAEVKEAKAEVKEAKAKVKEAKAEVKEAKAEVKEAKAEPGITLPMLQELLPQKAEAHKSEIKDKLTELGAKNLRLLKSEKYDEFYDFLTNLA